MKDALCLSHITHTITDGDHTRNILHDVSLDIGKGETVSIMGASGSGKTTLLSVAGFLLTPTSGTVIVAGQDAHSLSSADRTHIRMNSIGFVFQQPQLLGSLTALQQLTYPRMMAGCDNEEYRAMELLDRVGLADKAHHKPHQLSGGQRQRVTIARALMGNPYIIFADEPTAALDKESGNTVMDMLIDVADSAALVVVTHDDKVGNRCDIHYHMEDGQLSQQS